MMIDRMMNMREKSCIDWYLFGHTDYLGIAEFIKSYLPMLATDTRRLVSTERIGWDTIVHIVELHHPTLYMASEVGKCLSILSEYICPESIDRIIRELYRLFDRQKSNDRQDWPEDLLSPDSHISRDISEDHRCKVGIRELRRNRNCRKDRCSLRDSIIILFGDTRELTLRHEWSDIGRWIERVSEFFREEPL